MNQWELGIYRTDLRF